MARLFEDIRKYNPYHGSDGRFTSSGGAASVVSSGRSGKTGGQSGSGDRKRQGEQLKSFLDHGITLKNPAAEMMRDAGKGTTVSWKENAAGLLTPTWETQIREMKYTKGDGDNWTGSSSWTDKNGKKKTSRSETFNSDQLASFITSASEDYIKQRSGHRRKARGAADDVNPSIVVDMR